MKFLDIAGFAVSFLSLIGIYYTFRGVQYAREQLDLSKSDGQERRSWAEKHGQAFGLILQTNKWMLFEGANQQGYHVVFRDAQLRTMIETYLIEWDSGRNNMHPRVIDAAYFSLPLVQDVIQKTIETVDRFKQEHPAQANTLDLG